MAGTRILLIEISMQLQVLIKISSMPDDHQHLTLYFLNKVLIYMRHIFVSLTQKLIVQFIKQ